ncbi:VHS-domain-containing protein [Fistulina hepatica ATCC 64428]|uniref:Vacuolar protein sorting-associated protein 27 n=1 Tax=Fistulina hepatica ATCC 64428 TaxID=1128425 RepID=A0A0D7AK92_9AGAR|nr:VHS-domain-containing protein [Fistulina hepatica ATCC 64428]
MSALGSWLWGTSQIDEAVEKATSELIPSGSEDMALNLEICDQIRSKSAPAKEAMRALKSRLNHKNPNVQLLALSLTDVCIKNGGDHFLVEIASREFMDNLVSILKMPSLNSDVKQTILRLVQNWGNTFSSNPALSYVTTTYKSLQHEGFNFPPLDYANANAALIDTRTAPEWIDSDVCLRCRDPFTFTNRKHHCRNCGQVFDQKCSSKTMALPHFGIVQSVRVCDACYNKQHKHHDKIHRHTKSLGPHGHRTARELEDRELQRAIQLSLEEVGAAGSWRPGYVPTQPSAMPWQRSEPPIVERNTDVAVDEEDDPDLKAAIEASLREATAPKPSAPIATPGSEAPVQHNPTGLSQSYPPSTVRLPNIPNYDLEPLEEDAILTFSQTIEQV